MAMELLENAESAFRSREFRWSATRTYLARRGWMQASSACLYRTEGWRRFSSFPGGTRRHECRRCRQECLRHIYFRVNLMIAPADMDFTAAFESARFLSRLGPGHG